MMKRKLYEAELFKRFPNGLDKFLFAKQMQVVNPILSFLKEWCQWKAEYISARIEGMHGNEVAHPEKPATTLHLWGPAETGKTLVAQGIARFLALNMRFLNIEYILWPDLVRDFDRVKEIDWESPDILILDRFDRWNPQQRQQSTYILQLMGLPFARKFPTILVTNRDLDSLRSWMAKDVYGNANGDAKIYAEYIYSDIYRQLQNTVGFRALQRLPGFAGGKDLRRLAVRDNDMSAFDFVKEYNGGLEVWF